MTTREMKAGMTLLLALGLAGGTGVLASPQQSDKQTDAKTTASTPPSTRDNNTRTDLYGDPLPSGAIARLGTVRFRHGAMLRDVLISPDGHTLISAGGDVVKVLDAQTGRLQRQFPFTSPFVNGVNLSPDGKLLAVAQYGRQKMRFWDLTSGTEVFPFGDSPPRASRAVLSLNGELLAALELEQPPVVTLWDIRKGKKIRTIDSGVAARAWTVRSLAFSPNGQLLAYPSETGVRVWDFVAGKERYALDPGAKTAAGCVTFSADGKLLATADLPMLNAKAASIYLWDMTTGKKVGVLQGHEERMIGDLAASPQDNVLASVGGDGRILFWDLVKRQEIVKSGGPRQFFSRLYFSTDGRILVLADSFGVLRLWDAHTHQELAATATRGNTVHWVSFAPDGQTLIGTDRNQIGLWEPLIGRPRRIMHDQVLDSYGAAFSPDSKTMARVARESGHVILLDIATGKLIRRFGEGGKPVFPGSCTFSADGRRLASSTFQEDIIRIWDVASGKELQQLKGQKTPGVLAFAPDGATLVSGSGPSRGDYTVRLWNLATGAEIWRKVTQPLTLFDVKFSPDGHTVALVGALPGLPTVGGTVRLLESATGKELKHLDGHRGWVERVAFSPDGRMLATGSEDKTIRLWEIATGKERQCLQGHQNRIWSLSFSPDGRLLASASFDATALVWDLTGRFRDGSFQERRLSAAELKRCWDDLADPDAARAYGSIRSLTGSPKETVAFLKEHLPPLKAVDPKRAALLLAALDSDQFAERDKAMTELEQLGLAVEPALHAALDAKPSLEVRRRIEAVLDKLAGGPRLRFLRSLEVLEHIGTAEARQVLTKLSQVTAEMWPTQEAEASLARLAARPAVRP
jgi:WD40 repeat protein